MLHNLKYTQFLFVNHIFKITPTKQEVLSYTAVWGSEAGGEDPQSPGPATQCHEDCTWTLERPEHESIRLTFPASGRDFGLLKRMAEDSGHTDKSLWKEVSCAQKLW